MAVYFGFRVPLGFVPLNSVKIARTKHVMHLGNMVSDRS